MAFPDVTTTLARARAVLERRPRLGVHDDSPALAHWQGGTAVRTTHDNGSVIDSDMPEELGGGGGQVTPGWLFRAGLAACSATAIAMTAAAEGIELTTLDVRVTSRSDTRGLLGMTDADGCAVDAAPFDLAMEVRIAARGVAASRLRAIAERGCRCSPVQRALEHAPPLAHSIHVLAD